MIEEEEGADGNGVGKRGMMRRPEKEGYRREEEGGNGEGDDKGQRRWDIEEKKEEAMARGTTKGREGNMIYLNS